MKHREVADGYVASRLSEIVCCVELASVACGLDEVSGFADILRGEPRQNKYIFDLVVITKFCVKRIHSSGCRSVNSPGTFRIHYIRTHQTGIYVLFISYYQTSFLQVSRVSQAFFCVTTPRILDVQ